MEVAGSPKILQVAIPIFPNIIALDFVGPYEVLHILPNVNVVFVSHSKGLYSAELGMLSFQVTATFDEAHMTSLYTTSVCSGSLLLGAAGILQGSDNPLDVLTDAVELWCQACEHSRRPTGENNYCSRCLPELIWVLRLAALITDETTAKVVQLMMEYDPQPPFNCGSPAKANPEVVATAKAWVEKVVQQGKEGSGTASCVPDNKYLRQEMVKTSAFAESVVLNRGNFS